MSSGEVMPFDPALGGRTVNTRYSTWQLDMFSSGLAARIGPHGFAIWAAIKAHADFRTGECWPSIRRLAEITGMAKQTAQDSIAKLSEEHLLRVSKKGVRNMYVARERLDVRIGGVLICTLVVDYTPGSMKEKMKAIEEGRAGDHCLGQVDLIPAQGLVWDQVKGAHTADLATLAAKSRKSMQSVHTCPKNVQVS